MAWRITCDTGGTFTDLVVADENGFRTLAKASTTPEHMAAGIETALERAADQLDLELAELLGNAERFVLATTKATNAILEGTTAKTAFVTTRGCRDLLLFKEGGRADPFDYTEPTPRPYVPRYLTFEVTERVASDGEVLIPLVESEVVEIAKRMKELEVEAIAVCFLWSIAHPSTSNASSPSSRSTAQTVRSALPTSSTRSSVSTGAPLEQLWTPRSSRSCRVTSKSSTSVSTNWASAARRRWRPAPAGCSHSRP